MRTVTKESVKRSRKKQRRLLRRKQLAKAEREVIQAESALTALDALFGQHASDYEKLRALEEKRAAAEAALDAAYAAWEALSG